MPWNDSRVCPICHESYTPTHPNNQTCSLRCGALLRANRQFGPIETRLCPVCGTAIPPRENRREWRRACCDECEKVRKFVDEETRFWRLVDQRGGPDACWPWKGSTGSSGYGGFQIVREEKRRTVSAHRYALMTITGPFPSTLHACHNCPSGDNPLCCNPAHLFIGTPQDNTYDMIAKGRQRSPGPPRGERNQNAKLTPDSVRAIRSLAGNGLGFREIGRRFGITGTNVASVVKRETWKHVDP